MRGFALILFGLFIDGLQAMFTFVGANLIPLTGPLGPGISIAISISLTIIFGGAFLLVSALTGTLYPGLAIPVFFGEMIPILDILPGWTLLAIATTMRKRAQEGKGGMVTTLTAVALSAGPGGSTNAFQTARTALRATRTAQTAPQQEGPVETQPERRPQSFAFTRAVDGLRAANDNRSYAKKTA